jgi:hypothetical protein
VPPVGEVAEFSIGAAVDCQDGECGVLRRLVIDSHNHAITHLVVEPGRRNEKKRLVPIDLVEATTTHVIRLRCTSAQFMALDASEETGVTPGFDPASTSSMPLVFGLRGARIPGAASTGINGPMRIKPHAVTEDNLKDSEGEVWRGQHVHASDGPIGHVYGLVVDSDGELSHVLLGEGHMWGRKEVAIPVSAVRFVVDDGIYLNMTKKQIGDLPAVDLEKLAGGS